MKNLPKLTFFLLILPCIAMSDNLVRDPTQPPDAIHTDETGSSTGPVLQAIFTSPGTHDAIINQQMVGVGDKIEEYTVTSITENAVELTKGNADRLVLELAPNIKERK